MINIVVIVFVVSVFFVSCSGEGGDKLLSDIDIKVVDSGCLLIKFDKKYKKYSVEYDPVNEIRFVNLDGVCSDKMLKDVVKEIGKFNLDTSFIFIRVVNAEVENVSFFKDCNATLLSYENCRFSSKFSFNNFKKVGKVSIDECNLNGFNILTKKIKELSVYNSRGVSADINLDNKIEIERLSIVNCGLSRLPKNIYNTKGLKMLVLSFNNIVDTLDVCQLRDLELLGLDCVGDAFLLKTDCKFKAKIKKFSSNECEKSKSMEYNHWINSVTAHRYSLHGDIVF